MQSQFSRILGSLIFFAAVSIPNVGYADGWIWGPFSKSSSSRDASPLYSNSTGATTNSSWIPSMKWPKMPWQNSTPKVNSYSRSNTSTWGKVSKASKRWWTKTTELLDPYPDPKPSTYSSSSDSQTSKPGFFQGWLPKKEPEGPKTANDFFRQPTLN